MCLALHVTGLLVDKSNKATDFIPSIGPLERTIYVDTTAKQTKETVDWCIDVFRGTSQPREYIQVNLIQIPVPVVSTL